MLSSRLRMLRLRSTRRVRIFRIKHADLARAVGGDDDETVDVQTGGDDAGATTTDIAYDDSNRKQSFDVAVDLPAPPTVHDFDPVPPATTADLQHHFEAQVDVAQNYQDLASPGQLEQPTTAQDCFNISMLNSLNAYDHQSIDDLVTPTRNPNVVQVHTFDRNDQGVDEYVHPWPLQNNGATSDDANLVAVFNATTLQYHPRTTGGDSLDAAGRVGAYGYEAPADEIFRAFQRGEGGAVVVTGMAEHLITDDESALREFNILPDHVYQIAGMIHNDADGLDYGVVRDPFGFAHPSPMPLSEVNRPFVVGQIARFKK